MSAHDPRLNGKKCGACGHALSHHNTLSYCQIDSCFGSCTWHVSFDMDALKAMRQWNEEQGAGRVKRRMLAKGLRVIEEKGYFYAATN